MFSKLVTCLVTMGAAAMLVLIGGAGNGPPEDPEVALQRMLVAMGSRSYEQACELVVTDGGALVDGPRLDTCVASMRAYVEGIRPSAVHALRDVDVPPLSGLGGRAEIRGDSIEGLAPPLSQAVFHLVEVDGKWYVVS